MASKTPERLSFAISPTIAEKFRNHCTKNHLIMSRLLEEMIAEYLIQEGIVSSWVALNNEQLERGEEI